MRFDFTNSLGVILNAQTPGFHADYFWYIYLPIGLWILLLIILLAALLRKYTFGNWIGKNAENKNPYETETLGLPRGLMRGLLSLSLLFVVILFETYNLQTDAESEMKFMEFLTAFQMMIAFYFGSKVAHHVTSTDRHKAKFKKEVALSEPIEDVQAVVTEETEVPTTEEFVEPDDEGSVG